jgi:hypothetical protein
MSIDERLKPSVVRGGGALTIREIARRVHRDVKAVHGDVHEQLNRGVLHRNDSMVVFPYEAGHVDVEKTPGIKEDEINSPSAPPRLLEIRQSTSRGPLIS